MRRAALAGLFALTCSPALAQPPALHVEIRCDGDDLRVGDEIPITFIVSNVGDASFDYGSSLPYRFGALNFDLETLSTSCSGGFSTHSRSDFPRAES